MTLPNFLILGAGKAGTTSLHYYLQQHPQIFMPPQKETNFFVYEGQTLNFQDPNCNLSQYIITQLADYQDLFSQVKDEIAIGEACPRYLSHSSRAAARIQHYIPDAKLISILRNPVDRAFSSYLMQVREGRESLSFAEVIAAEQKRYQQNWSFGEYTQTGFYTSQLRCYFERFSPAQIRIFLYEDLQSNPQELIQNIFQFLGVEDTFQPNTQIRHNASGLPQNPWLYSSISAINHFLTGTSFFKKSLKQTFPKEWVYQFNRRYEIFRSQYFQHDLQKPELALEMRIMLTEMFRKDILELQDLIQRDLSHWLELASST